VHRLAVAGVAAVLVLGVAAAAAKSRPVLATVWNGNVVSLIRVDPMSLRPAGGPSLQTVGGLVYVAACNDRCFRIVDPRTGTLAGTAETPRTSQLVGGS
jgi:hypothetical protein